MTSAVKQQSITRSQHPVLAFFIPVLLSLALLQGCSRQPDPVTLSGATMGTTWHVTWVQRPEGPEPAGLQERIELRLVAINSLMSTYQPDSAINEFNRLPALHWWQAPPEFLEVFLVAREISQATAGAYDVTVAPLVDAWGFGPEAREGVPAETELSGLVHRVGQQAIDVDPERHALRKQRPLALDFSSIAKGYGVDVIAALLEDAGINDYLVEIGGELRVAGSSPRGGPWRVAIERPDPARREALSTLELNSAAVATSGDYRNYYEVDGQRYSHTIDPRTGRPIRHGLASVTVVHESAMLADGWATALNVLGPEDALPVAVRNGLAAYLVSRDGDRLHVEKSPAMAALLQ
jgi:thiamine biosynthesis lipoprotein